MADKLRTLSNGIYNVSLFSSSLLKRKKKMLMNIVYHYKLRTFFAFVATLGLYLSASRKKLTSFQNH